MTGANHRWRKIKSALASALSFAAAALVIAPLGLVFFHLLRNGAASGDEAIERVRTGPSG